VPGPTIAVTRGSKLRVKVVNTLGAESTASLIGNGGMDEVNRFYRPNTTNLHMHGLHVSPLGRSNNASVMIEPGAEHEYEYDIDVDHPTGTFLYRPNFHGSTALQLDGGMAGAIVVLDDPDELELASTPQEHVILLQVAGFGDSPKTNARLAAQFAESALPVELSRPDGPTVFMTVNGQLAPQLSMARNEPRRLRVVNANGALFVRLALTAADLGTPQCLMVLVAMDGIYFSAPAPVAHVVIPPGGRACVIVRCSGSGAHELRSVALTDSEKLTLSNAATFEGLLMHVSVSTSSYGGAARLPPRLPPLPRYLADAAAASAPATSQGFQFSGALNTINGLRFREDAAPIATLSLGKAHDFALSSIDAENHPLHWHVNHVQIVAMAPSMPQSNETMFVGQWRDTVPASSAGTVTIRVVPHRFVGNMRGQSSLAVGSDLGMLTDAAIDDARKAASQAPSPATAEKAKAALLSGLCGVQGSVATTTTELTTATVEASSESETTVVVSGDSVGKRQAAAVVVGLLFSLLLLH
jgi:FtsP/CotA-like multicopper oxidase with cupredoxin domain